MAARTAAFVKFIYVMFWPLFYGLLFQREAMGYISTATKFIKLEGWIAQYGIL